MPTVLTDVNQFDATITVPVDGDVRNAASVQVAFQSYANRTRWLYNQLANGLIQAQPVASTGALAALTAPTTNALAYVAGLGLYTYDPTSTYAAMSTHIIVPASAPVAGRWFSPEAAYMALGGFGLNVLTWQIPVPLRNASVVPSSNLPFAQFLDTTTHSVTPTGVYVDTGSVSPTVNLSAGDWIRVDVTGTITKAATANAAFLALATYDGTTTTNLVGSYQGWVDGTNALSSGFHLCAVYQALVAIPSFQYKLRAFAPGTDVVQVGAGAAYPTNWIVSAVRP